MAAVPPSSSMRNTADNPWFAGVDGCRTGWVAAFAPAVGGDVRVRIVPRFADVLGAPEAPSVVAVDIPIGLPERAGPGGRAAENAVRPLLGARQSSVFSVPSRAALAAEDYADACRIAFASSEPPRKVSKQLFMLAPKIREVDALLRDYAAFGRARLRGPSRGRVLAAQRRARVARAQEGQGPMLRARTCLAAKPARHRRPCRGTGEQHAAEGRRRR